MGRGSHRPDRASLDQIFSAVRSEEAEGLVMSVSDIDGGFTETSWKDPLFGKEHNVDAPSAIVEKGGIVFEERWMQHGVLSRDDGPCLTHLWRTDRMKNSIKTLLFRKDGELVDGAAGYAKQEFSFDENSGKSAGLRLYEPVEKGLPNEVIAHGSFGFSEEERSVVYDLAELRWDSEYDLSPEDAVNTPELIVYDETTGTTSFHSQGFAVPDQDDYVQLSITVPDPAKDGSELDYIYVWLHGLAQGESILLKLDYDLNVAFKSTYLRSHSISGDSKNCFLRLEFDAWEVTLVIPEFADLAPTTFLGGPRAKELNKLIDQHFSTEYPRLGWNRKLNQVDVPVD